MIGRKKETEKIKPPTERKIQAIAPKGMRDLIGEEYWAFQGFIEKASEVAVYYGFTPIITPVLEHEEIFIRSVGETSDIVEKEMYRLRTRGGDRLALRPEATAGIMRAYLENGMQALPQPVMLFTEGSYFRHDRPQKGRYREFRHFDMEIIGTAKSIADALVIKLAAIILGEAGLKNLELRLNSIGDKECRGNWRRELVNYYRRQTARLCADCHRRLRDNPLRLLDCKNPDCQPIKENAPDSISFLCRDCQGHFKEVLEYLESVEVSYTIDKNLVRGLDYYSRTVFEIFSAESPPDGRAGAPGGSGGETASAPAPLAVASGGRYDYLAKILGSPRDIPAVGFAIGVDRVVESEQYVDLSPRLLKKPKVFFIQLGFEAKLKSIPVIETLRAAKIPLLHSLSKDSLSTQLAVAEKLKIPYVLILGQKEVADRTIIVRKMQDRSQKTIKLNELSAYLRKLA